MHRTLFGLCLLWFCHTADAGRFVIGVEELRYLPYYNYEHNQYGGMAHDVLEAFAKAHGHQFEYRALPIRRLYIEFLAGNVDMKFPDNPYWAASDKAGKTVHYSRPVIAFTDGVLVLPNRRGAGESVLHALGTVRGFTAFDYLEALQQGRMQLREMDSLDELIQATLHHRVDGSYFNVVVAERFLSKTLNLPGALVFDPQLPHTRSHYHLSSLKHPQLLVEFDQFLQDNPKLLASLRQKWEIPEHGLP